MSVFSLHAPPHVSAALLRAGVAFCRSGGLLAVLLLALGSGCGSDSVLQELMRDGSFGADPRYGADGSLDGGLNGLDAATPPPPPSVRVRFVHGLPNTGALSLCHDPDGPGPIAATLLRDEVRSLRAEFGTRSAVITVPAIASGTLTLQRDPRTTGAVQSFDGGLAFDGGVTPADPCDPATREATLSLPIDGRQLDPRAPAAGDALLRSELSPTLADAPSFTLLGSGFALNDGGVAQRVKQAESSYLAQHPGDSEGASAAGQLEQASLDALFGPRALIQRDPVPSDGDTFTLSLYHAIPDIVASGDAGVGSSANPVGAIRVCVTAGTREIGALPAPPAAGVPFRMRRQIASGLNPLLTYEFRVFSQRELDASRQSCSTTGLSPIARATIARFEGGHAYTLAVLGAISPASLCSANDVSLVRASCEGLASKLSAQIIRLDD